MAYDYSSEQRKEYMRKYKKQYRLKNLDKVLKQSKDWNNKNRDRRKVTNNKWYMLNKEITAKRTRLSKLKRYGITEADYNQMFVNQNGTCAICKQLQNNGENLYIDHCHITGKVRGLLCNNCNLAIGLLKDNTNIILEAAKYLSK
jgi:hypothetical protein